MRELPIPMHVVYRHPDGTEILSVAGEMEDAFDRPEKQVHRIGHRREYQSLLQIWRGARTKPQEFEHLKDTLAHTYHLAWEQIPAIKAVGM